MAAITAITPRLPRWRAVVVLAFGIIIFASFIHTKPEVVGQARNIIASKAPYLGQQPNYGGWNSKKSHLFESSAQPPAPVSDEAKAVWTEYANILTEANFTFPQVPLRSNVTGWPIVHFQSVDFFTPRLDRLNVTEAMMDEMTFKHGRVAERIKALAPRIPFIPGTRGIVVTTSVEAMAFQTVSLRMLRKTGTTLPVEIWIYDRNVFAMDPYGLAMCRDIWRPLGAECKFVGDYLPDPRPPPLDEESEKYLNKIDAMMFSSFEQVLFMDSDNNAMMSLDNVFDEEPFTSSGFVLWPDYWGDTSSLEYYKISGVEEDPVWKRASTESGQVMYNKATHGAMIMMAGYYCRYPNHFQRLLDQDEVGMGDKESYLKAAKVFKLPFYQVAEPPDRLGYRCDGERAVASGQHHPADDHYLESLGLRRGGRLDMLSDGTAPRILFIHGNLPKYDPQAYLDWYHKDVWNDQLRCDRGEGEAHRMYGDPRLTILKFGWDVEKTIWDQMRWVACETERYQVEWWNGTEHKNWRKRPNVCRDFIAWYEELLGPEGLEYDPSLSNPYAPGGEFGKQLSTGHWSMFPWS